ncbi:MAG: hypothetical protein JSR70_10890 [Proteobacteria bacterium]|nr:hypothetical protein [Pseudomonadota bacterium]
MKFSRPLLLVVSILSLSACSRAPNGDGKTEPSSPAAKAARAANAEFARLQKQGADATAREITKIEYPSTRSLMRASGIDAALGGEAKADAALQKLFALYEQKSRVFAAELPGLFNKRSGGGGGFGGGGESGYGGMAASTTTAGMQNEAAEQTWEQGQEAGQSSGSQTTSTSNGSSTTEWTQDGYANTTTYEGNLPEGLKGKVTTRVKTVACPDASGKIEIEFESTSDLGSASGSAQTKVSSKLVQHLDDDANFIDDDMDSDVHVEQTTGSGSHVDVSDGLSTSRGEAGSKVNGRNRNASNEDVELAQALAKLGRFAAMQALDSAKKAIESGKCVKLDVRSDPAKRTGAKPNTAYTLFAEPRAKSDGAPTRGTVKATLSGEHMLNPRDKKVPADAQFDYQNPEKKDQSATIDFEARSKRGVGKASLQFDTKKGGYRIVVGGGDPVNQVVCDIDHSFVLNGKLFGTEFSGGMDGTYKFVRTPNIPGLQWKASGTYHIDLPNGPGAPGTLSIKAREATTRAGGIADKNAGYTDVFTLTPVADCK